MGMFSSPKPPTVTAPPRQADRTKAQMEALAYAEMQRRMRQSSGRDSMFITTKPQKPGGGNTVRELGQRAQQAQMPTKVLLGQ